CRLLCGMEGDYGEEWNDSEFHAGSAKRWEEAVQTRFQASRHLRNLNARVQQLQTLLDHELTEKAMAEDQVNAAIERRHSSYESHQREIDLFVEACRSWMLSVVELKLTPPGRLLDTVPDGSQAAEVPHPSRLPAEAASAD